MKNEDLKKILSEHKKWLDSSGEEGKRAELAGADLCDANLRGANLRDADLSGADLRSAYLRGANLVVANLREANLRDANLRGAELAGASLVRADLRYANLHDASLYLADLRDANLDGAVLRDADFLLTELNNEKVVILPDISELHVGAYSYNTLHRISFENGLKTRLYRDKAVGGYNYIADFVGKTKGSELWLLRDVKYPPLGQYFNKLGCSHIIETNYDTDPNLWFSGVWSALINPSRFEELIKNSKDIIELDEGFVKQYKDKYPFLSITQKGNEIMSENNKVTIGGAIKGTGKTLGKSVMTGAQMAAAYEFNCAVVDAGKWALKEAGVPEELLDVEAVDTIMHVMMPLMLMLATEKYPGVIPGEKYIKPAAEMAMTAESFKKLVPLMQKIRPKLIELAKKGKQVAHPSAGALGAKTEGLDLEFDDEEFEKNKEKLNKTHGVEVK